jgi:hypothetical protein
MNSDRTSSWIVRFGAMPRLASAAGHAYRLKGQLLKNEFYLAGPMQRLLLRYTQSLLTQMAQTAVCRCVTAITPWISNFAAGCCSVLTACRPTNWS